MRPIASTVACGNCSTAGVTSRSAWVNTALGEMRVPVVPVGLALGAGDHGGMTSRIDADHSAGGVGVTGGRVITILVGVGALRPGVEIGMGGVTCGLTLTGALA